MRWVLESAVLQVDRPKRRVCPSHAEKDAVAAGGAVASFDGTPYDKCAPLCRTKIDTAVRTYTDVSCLSNCMRSMPSHIVYMYCLLYTSDAADE